MKNYKEYYDNFLASYQSGNTGAEEVGKAIADMAQFFCESNTEYAKAEIIYNKVAAIIEQTPDESGKNLSSAKAKIISESRDEFGNMLRIKRDVENIDQVIKSLKSLQMGILKEFSHMSNS